MPTIRLTVAYDGTEFSGWQVQPGQRTVQGVIEEGIHKLTGENVRILSAGRTDAGVHALGQVVSFQTLSTIPPVKWREALQSQLPADVVVRDSVLVDDDFHATYSALSKRYRYVIVNREGHDPFLRRYAWRIKGPLDASAMREASRCFLGRHDFRSFESDGPNTHSGIRTVSALEIERVMQFPGWAPEALLPSSVATDGPAGRGDFICLEIEADGFLYNMVRAILGTLVNVGRGKWTAADVQRALEACDRSCAGETAPAKGLYLVCVHYPDQGLREPSSIDRAKQSVSAEHVG